jgi:glycosyltransferase involved in cell wall biosynthesis
MSHNRIKILFVLPSLKAGGAERVISTVARKLDKNIFNSILVVLGSESDAVYPTDGIDVVYLNKPRLIKSIRPIFNIIRNKKPDIVVGSIAHVNRLLSIKKIYFRNTIFVGREASVDTVMEKFSNSRNFSFWMLYKNYYRHMDKIICQSNDMAEQLLSHYKLSSEKIVIINNPASENLKKRIAEINDKKIRQIITIGRLSMEKGYDRTLKVLSKLKIPFQYTIIGNGGLKDDLTDLASKLHILDKINFIDYTHDIEKYLSISDLFVQGSHVEGFPNALLESCVVGTPVVALNAPGGTKEIIENNVNGYLAENEDDFLFKIETALLKKDWNSEVIRESVIKKFNQNLIISNYETLFMDLYKTLKTNNV